MSVKNVQALCETVIEPVFLHKYGFHQCIASGKTSLRASRTQSGTSACRLQCARVASSILNRDPDQFKRALLSASRDSVRCARFVFAALVIGRTLSRRVIFEFKRIKATAKTTLVVSLSAKRLVLEARRVKVCSCQGKQTSNPSHDSPSNSSQCDLRYYQTSPNDITCVSKTLHVHHAHTPGCLCAPFILQKRFVIRIDKNSPLTLSVFRVYVESWNTVKLFMDISSFLETEISGIDAKEGRLLCRRA